MISKQLFGPTLFRLSQVVLCLGFVRRCQCLLFRDRTPPWSYCFPILPCLLKKVAVQKGRGCQLLHHFLLFIFEAGGLLASVGCILPGSTLYLQRPTASKSWDFPVRLSLIRDVALVQSSFTVCRAMPVPTKAVLSLFRLTAWCLAAMTCFLPSWLLQFVPIFWVCDPALLCGISRSSLLS